GGGDRNRRPGRHRLPHRVGDETVEEVCQETEQVAGTEPAEEVADQVAERRTPRGRGPEEKGAHDGHRVRGSELGDARNERNDLEGDEDGGIERGADGRQDHHPGVPPHAEEIGHHHARREIAARLYSGPDDVKLSRFSQGSGVENETGAAPTWKPPRRVARTLREREPWRPMAGTDSCRGRCRAGSTARPLRLPADSGRWGRRATDGRRAPSRSAR